MLYSSSVAVGKGSFCLDVILVNNSTDFLIAEEGMNGISEKPSKSVMQLLSLFCLIEYQVTREN